MGLEISSSCLMQSMRDIDLPSAINTSRHDITREFFAPLLSCATRYDRGVGFLARAGCASMPSVWPHSPPTRAVFQSQH